MIFFGSHEYPYHWNIFCKLSVILSTASLNPLNLPPQERHENSMIPRYTELSFLNLYQTETFIVVYSLDQFRFQGFFISVFWKIKKIKASVSYGQVIFSPSCGLDDQFQTLHPQDWNPVAACQKHCQEKTKAWNWNWLKTVCVTYAALITVTIPAMASFSHQSSGKQGVMTPPCVCLLHLSS